MTRGRPIVWKPIFVAVLLLTAFDWSLAHAQEPECLPNESVWLEMADRGQLDKMPAFRQRIIDAEGAIIGRLDIIQIDSGDWWALERGATETCIRLRGVKWEPTLTEPEP